MKRQLGFGLLEILIAMVVLGVAVAGLVTFSKSALVASQDGRRYEIAMRLAESKLDEFRNFNSPTSATAPLTAYNGITTNSTGTTLTQSGDGYTVTWDAKDQYWNTATSAWQNSAPSGYTAPTSGQKVVTVTVRWKDSENKDKNLQLSSNISPSSSLLKSQLNGGLDSSRTGPKINITPGLLPDVVRIALGDGINKESSKPVPKLSKKSDSNSYTVQFDTTTYQTTGNTSHKLALQDNAVVYCTCNNAGASGSAYLPTKPIYIQSSKVQYWQATSQLNTGPTHDHSLR
ncbi:type IV pilus modification PilV family protein [Aeromonas sanarellii]